VSAAVARSGSFFPTRSFEAARLQEGERDHAGKLSRRNQPTGPEQGGNLQTRVVQGWVAVQKQEITNNLSDFSLRFSRAHMSLIH
jgi:hypothetical protein